MGFACVPSFLARQLYIAFYICLANNYNPVFKTPMLPSVAEASFGPYALIFSAILVAYS